MPGPTEPRCTIPGFASGPRCAALIPSFVLVAALLSHAALAAAEAHPASSSARDPSVESSFLALRELGDRIRTREARAEDATPERTAYPALQSAVAALLPDSAGAPAEAMRSAFARGEMDLPPAPSADGASVSGCEKAPARDAPLAALRSWTYACYGLAANAIAIDGRVTDRLTLLADMARSPDPARRRHLLEAMQPMFRTINGDGGEQSPFRRMQPMVAAEWRAGGSPVADNLRALGLDEAQLEPWLVAVLQAWSELTAGDDLEPWDYEYAGNPVERQLGARVPLGRLREINDAFHASLGADIAALNIHYDIERRPGKTAVAFTDFGARPRRRADGSWSTGEPWVIAGYATGGIGNLNEILHETGHAIHIAAIRTSPAFADWPDSNAFTEAIAEIFSQEVYEQPWQQRWLGARASAADNLRSRYAGIVLDVAWSLFELRVYADPAADPDRVWNDIAARYLHVRPHPGLSWWARRGQLVDSPGYMINYGLGAVLAADMRARARELRGSASGPDAGYYAWISERLLRFGRERSADTVLRDFLGRAPNPEALLADLRRAATPGR